MTAEMKRCSRCGEEKPLEAFHRNRGMPDGRQRRCAACINSIMRARRRAAGVAARPTYPDLKSRDWLIQKHVREMMTSTEIAMELGCSAETVRSAMHLAGIQVIQPVVLRTLRAGRAREGIV